MSTAPAKARRGTIRGVEQLLRAAGVTADTLHFYGAGVFQNDALAGAQKIRRTRKSERIQSHGGKLLSGWLVGQWCRS